MSQTIVGNLAVELGMSTEEFQRALAHAQASAQKAATSIQSKIDKAGSKGNPQGLINLSRAADDLQYGLRGIVNNIEGIVTGFGGTAAMAGGLTLAAIAANQFGDDLAAAFDKMVDGRTEMQKLTDQTRYAASVFGELEAKIVATQKRLVSLADTDANAGIGGFIRRNAGFNPNALNAQNRDVFGQLADQLITDSRESAKRKSNTNTGLDFLDPGEPKAMRAMRSEAVNRALPNEFQRNAAFGKLVDDLAANKFGGNYNKAREQARELIGQAAQGIEEGFKTLNKVTKGKVEAERIRVLAENIAEEKRRFDQETGAPEELARMEKRRSQIENRQFDEYQRAASEQAQLFSRRDSILANMNRSEIVGSADVFARNLNAGQKSPELAELEKINESIKELGTMTGILN